MKASVCGLLFLLAAPLARPAAAQSGERIIPAGALVQCTIDEPKLSSKTAEVGDPVLCQVNHSAVAGRIRLPYGSYLVGRFEDYKDPGHFVGKGWMELKFDRLIVEPDITIPLAAKVVYVPGYQVDKHGKILGKGHPVRDVVEWSIPLLWPIDLLNLPRRGPRPTLKEETRLTLKILDDIGVPAAPGFLPDGSGLIRRAPARYLTPLPPPASTLPGAAFSSAVAYTYAGQSAQPAAIQSVPGNVVVSRNGAYYRTISPN